MMNIQKITLSIWFWLSIILVGIGLESVALYYQYILDEWPCVICIQIRLWLALMVVLATVGLIGRTNKVISITALLSLSLVSLGLFERSYQLLGVERGFVEGLCSMDLGLPQWFAIDKWIPWIFEVKTTCGYTPYVFYKITMAEILIGFHLLLLLFFIATLITKIKSTK